MLTQIAGPATAKTEDAVDLLVGCHQRIRHFTATALRLSQAVSAPAEQITQAASGVHRYYTVSLPLHEQDEEETLRPRLDTIADETLRHALAAMTEQHQAIEQYLEHLLPLLVLLQNNPHSLRAVAPEMRSLVERLEQVFATHLQMEEDVIFPAIRRELPDSVRQAILSEMRQRRAQEPVRDSNGSAAPPPSAS